MTLPAARRWLAAFYTFELLALAVWIGGLVVIVAAVIPAVFNSFGMEPGGRFLTRVFDGYNRLVIGAALMLLGSSAFRLWGSRAQGLSEAAPSKSEAALLTLMTLVAIVVIFVLGPSSVTLQEQAFAVKDQSAKKAAYDAFFRVHMVVRGLYVLNLVLGIALLAVKTRSFFVKREAFRLNSFTDHE